MAAMVLLPFMLFGSNLVQKFYSDVLINGKSGLLLHVEGTEVKYRAVFNG